MTDQVILVDEQDCEVGAMDKLEAHHKGLLHRAFSVLLFNSRGDLLIQQRADSKYHSAGLWTNTCCSHPRPGEQTADAVHRRLQEELGISTPVTFAYRFTYKAHFDNQLTEYEVDHVYVGTFDGTPHLNPLEAQDWKFIPMVKLREDVRLHPERYTAWFRMILNHPELSQATQQLSLS
jgi:isopentenyl-diphosphate delta-isomerase